MRADDATASWRDLDRRIGGTVVTPGDVGYDTARAVPNARFRSARPDVVVLCATPDDVAAALRAAGEAERSFSVRSGGHCFAGRSSAGDVVIDLRRLGAIGVDDESVRVGAGVRLGELYNRLAADGRTIAGGNGSTVGVSGLVLGGGLGILGRRHGLACDSLLSADVALADGSVVRCDPGHHPELFWALRGAGGGRFGAVTSLELRTVPAPPMTAFDLRWSFHSAAAVVDAWQRFAPDAPRDLAASLLVTAPADPSVEPAAVVAGTMAGDLAATREVLDPLRRAVGSAPVGEKMTFADYRAIKHRLEPADINLSHRTHVRSQFYDRPLPAEAIGALVDDLGRGRIAGHVRELDFTPWGGAYADVPADATAFPHRADRFLLKHGVAVPGTAPPADDVAARRWLARSFATVGPSGTGRVYPNFPDPELKAPGQSYFAQNLARLQSVKARYDPDGRFDAL
jgi:FAD/FMN-containing dehydrogenase